MSKVLHRSLRAVPRTAAGAEGVHIVDSTGKRYIDASGGAAVSCLGHAHPDVLAAMHAQIDKLAYAHTSFFTTEVAEALADHLIEHAPQGLKHVYFVSGGSEAIEAALKLARQYFVEIGQPERTVFVARRQSYHGNTLGALAVGGNEWRRRQFAPLLMAVGRVAPCYEYRDRRDRRESRRLYRAPARRTRGASSSGSDRTRHRLRRRAGRRRHVGRGAPDTGLLRGRASALRSARHPVHRRRSDVRHGPHRNVARGRTGRRGARPAGHRQGPRRRLPADRRAARHDGSSPPCAKAAACSSTATPTSAIRRPRRRPWRCNR